MTDASELRVSTVDTEASVVQAARRPGPSSWRVWIYPSAFLVALVGVWELLARLEVVEPYILPAPTAVLDRLMADWPVLWGHTVTTLAEIGAGFGLGAVVGVVLALPIAYSAVFRNTVYPLIVASQAVPKIAVAPLLVLWLGFGMWPKIVITALMVFFPVVVTAAEGFASVDRSLLELLRSVSAPRHQIFTRVTLPHSLPRIMAGLKIGITLAVVGAIVGEWVGADSGLGYLLVYANTFLDSTLLFAALVLLVVIGVALSMLIGGFERLLMPWQYRTRR